MSVQVMAYVWKHSPEREERLLVMLALADFADDDGLCWPSVRAIADKARITERGASGILGDLEASGQIVRKVGRGRGIRSTYIVVTKENPNPVPVSLEDARATKPERHSRKTRSRRQENPKPTTSLLEPSVEPSKEPSGATDSKSQERGTDDGKPTAAVPRVLRGGSDEYAAWLRANGWSDTGPSPSLRRPRAVPRVAQQLLGVAAPGQTRGEARFERETLRRGGPLEVEGHRWAGIAERRRRQDQEAYSIIEDGARLADVHLRRMP